jgi:hypothetical protein
MDNHVSSSFVFDESHRRFTILNIYDDDEDYEESEKLKKIYYYKIPVEKFKDNKVIKEEAFNPSQKSCCLIS